MTQCIPPMTTVNLTKRKLCTQLPRSPISPTSSLDLVSWWQLVSSTMHLDKEIEQINVTKFISDHMSWWFSKCIVPKLSQFMAPLAYQDFFHGALSQKTPTSCYGTHFRKHWCYDTMLLDKKKWTNEQHYDLMNSNVKP